MQFVGLEQGGPAYPVAFADSRDGITLADLVGFVTRGDHRMQPGEVGCHQVMAAGRNFELIGTCGRGGLVFTQLVVEFAELLDRCRSADRYRLQVGAGRYLDQIVLNRLLVGEVGKSVLFRVAGNDNGRDQLGHIPFGLQTEVTVPGKFPEVAGFVFFYGPLNLAFARIIAGDGQLPVTEPFIQGTQVGDRCPGCFFRITAFIHPGIYP